VVVRRPDEPPPGERRFDARTLALVALVAGIVGGLTGGAVAAWLAPGRGGSGAGVTVSATVPVDAAGSVADVVAKVLPSVVTVQAQGHDSETGTGVIIDSAGYILTSAHVIASAAGGGTIAVTRNQDVTPIPAVLVGEDAKSDLAVLRIDVGGGLPAAVLGHSGALRVGSPVIAIGTQLKLSGTVTTGIVSALDRTIPDPVGSGNIPVGGIQTDAAINPGSSGGPLLDALGQVVGINTAIDSVPGTPGGAGGATGSIGVGFAIPIDYASSIATEIIRTGRATHPYLGLSAVTLTAADAAATGRVPGALIRDLDLTGPAAAGGLRVGDVVTALDGVTITSGDQLIQTIQQRGAGDHVTVSYQRSGRAATAHVTLTEQQN
jgi:putative serine protease PepD